MSRLTVTKTVTEAEKVSLQDTEVLEKLGGADGDRTHDLETARPILPEMTNNDEV